MKMDVDELNVSHVRAKVSWVCLSASSPNRNSYQLHRAIQSEDARQRDDALGYRTVTEQEKVRDWKSTVTSHIL
jgi:hypothetical protein